MAWKFFMAQFYCNILQEWLKFSRIDLERNIVLWKELRELMSKVSPLGAAYQQWCNQLTQDYPALVSIMCFSY